MVKQRWQQNFTPLIILAFIVVVLVILLITTHLSKKQSLSKSENKIDSLLNENSRHLKKIEELQVELVVDNNRILDLTNDVIFQDSMSNFYKEEAEKNRLYYQKILEENKNPNMLKSNSDNAYLINQVNEKLLDCENKVHNCQGEIDELQRQIALHKSTIEQLRSRHDLPVLFFLYSSLSYYPTNYFDDSLIKKELNRIITINNWPYNSEYIEDLINSSPRLKYRGIKWAQQKLGCPIEASYLLIKGHKQDPERSDESDIVDVLFDSFEQFPVNFKLSSDHLRTINMNESETFKMLDSTISCLIANYNKNSKSKKRLK